MIESFKTEIVEAENGRNELLKWKLIIVAALSAVSLSIGEAFRAQNDKTHSYVHLAVCLIPLVCVYVDLLCKHLQMRILVISRFFQDCQIDESSTIKSEITSFKNYEKFCEQVRFVFSLEDWAQTGSTYLICLLVIGTSFFKYGTVEFYIILFSGITGLAITLLIDYSYRRKKNRLNRQGCNPVIY